MKILWIPVLLACSMAGPTLAQDTAALAEEGKAKIQEFAGTLKGALTGAIAEGGPVNAIAVCNVDAPGIAEALSTDGWSVARSSHKLRNPDNAPDPFTAAAIAEFLERQEAGEDPKDLVKAAVVEEDGTQVFRLVKAIPTAAACLTCHGGDAVDPTVVDKLAELYPADQARGFSIGEMRGVFTLTKVIEN